MTTSQSQGSRQLHAQTCPSQGAGVGQSLSKANCKALTHPVLVAVLMPVRACATRTPNRHNPSKNAGQQCARQTQLQHSLGCKCHHQHEDPCHKQAHRQVLEITHGCMCVQQSGSCRAAKAAGCQSSGRRCGSQITVHDSSLRCAAGLLMQPETASETARPLKLPGTANTPPFRPTSLPVAGAALVDRLKVVYVVQNTLERLVSTLTQGDLMADREERLPIDCTTSDLDILSCD